MCRCSGCNNLHLVADNLGWFRDGKTNIEDLMREKGNSVTTNVNSETLEFQLNRVPEEPKTQPVEIQAPRVQSPKAKPGGLFDSNVANFSTAI